MRLLVTGATGFLGRAIVQAGQLKGHRMVAVSRSGTDVPGAAECQACGDLATGTEAVDLSGVDTVINCAALVHQPNAPAAAYTPLNVDLPIALAKAAREAGARRFIQISSVAAIASRTPAGAILDDSATPSPATPYGASKLAADTALQELAGQGFDVISLRPPALFGPGVGAPFAQLMRAARLGLPLPLGAIRSLRSVAYVRNIADSVLCVADASEGMVQSGSFIVTDSLPITPPDLYSSLAWHNGHKGKLRGRSWTLPLALIDPLARLALGSRADSLLASAAFSGARFAETFSWQPEGTFEDAVASWVSKERRSAD